MILWCVSPIMYEQAKANWKVRVYHSYNWFPTDERDFCQFVGITDQERANYNDAWQLKVPSATYKKLKLMASDRHSSPHLETLFRVIEIKEAS